MINTTYTLARTSTDDVEFQGTIEEVRQHLSGANMQMGDGGYYIHNGLGVIAALKVKNGAVREINRTPYMGRAPKS